MPLTISQCFDLPARDDITALGFVVRLADGGDDAQKLADDYVITPTVAAELPVILASMRHTYRARGDLGRFVHGSFGSGKSHFLSFLGLLFESRDEAWAKNDATIRALAAEHRGWIAEARLLVVRLHMLTAAGRETGLDRAVYDAANQALVRRGKAPFEFLHVEGVIAEARREAELYGPQFWKRLEEGGIIASKTDFDAQAAGDAEERETLARAYLTWKGRDAASAGIDPNWADGLARLAQHVKGQGYGGMVLLLDEFLLWLREKGGPEFERAINQLNVVVDHADGARAVPVFIFVARQRNIQEFFPDLVEERQLHEHLGHHAKRFEVTNLEDVELRHVCKGRVLRRRAGREADVQRVVDALAQDHAKVLPAILHGTDLGYLRDVYPFHPALIETLIDVSSLMQRDRTALRLLYELLVLYYPDLELGKLLPVGCAFEAIFPEAGVEGSKRVKDLQAIHKAYYLRFQPAMVIMLREATETGGDFDAQRRHVLDMIVKTALLAEVSPRLRNGPSMTVERLVRLNDSEIKGETDRTKLSGVYQDLLALSRKVPALQLSGAARDATVRVVLDDINFGEILERARVRVAGQKHLLLSAFYKVLLPALGLKREQLDGDLDVKWHHTRRRGSVSIRNIRELTGAEFKPAAAHEFRILIDYPWDDPGHTVAEDATRAHDVRKREGKCMTVCWLPRHFQPAELEIVRDLAALEEILGAAGQEELLRELAPHERQQVVTQAENQATNLRQSLAGKLGEVYRDSGQVESFVTGIGERAPAGELDKMVQRLAQTMLDRQYPNHPDFGFEPKPEPLRLLCDWLGRATEKPDHTEVFSPDEANVLEGIGVPLELVQLGQTRASLRLDTRYIKTIRDELRTDQTMWDPIDRRLQETYALQPAVRNMLLVFVTHLESLRAQHPVHGDAVELAIDNKARTNVKLVRAPLLDLASWSRARELGPELFELSAPAGTRTLTEQDGYATALHRAAVAKRDALQGLHERLSSLHIGGKRVEELRTAIARLAPLATQPSDSCATLRDWLAQWPEEANNSARAAVIRVAAVRGALDALDETARRTLEHATSGPLAASVEAHVTSLRDVLSAGELERPLTNAVIVQWNTDARELLRRVLSSAEPLPPPPLPPPPPSTPPAPPSTARTLVAGQRVRTRDEQGLRAIAEAIVEQLRALPDEEVLLDVVVRRS